MTPNTTTISRWFALALGGLLLLAYSPALTAQRLQHVQGELLIQLTPHQQGKTWGARFQRLEGRRTALQAAELVSAPLNIWRYTFDYTRVPESKLLAEIRRAPEVLGAQFNHLVQMRSTLPNDPLINNQWQYLNTGQTGGLPDADLDADLAWDLATGGLTYTGDTIVVCVIDDGLETTHPDLQRNRWFNHAEIPNNGIDDDQNGYVDDYQGWSTVTNNDNIGSGGSHGTPVAGIVGADGHNNLGVTGLNWHVKVMVIKNNFNTTEAKVLAAYSYPLWHRMRYNATQGAEGAFVVATNASWGVNGGQPADSPLWCAFYDTLGAHGILNCGATANQNVNVDEMGDLPTTCPSEYLIGVTNTNNQDQKVTSAGYGLQHIDLAAPGNGTYTLAVGGNYGIFNGTSAATPHVTAAIGLLYSSPCPALMTLAYSDPAAAARWVRTAILEGVDPLPSLQGITATGGRLNVFQSMLALLTDCGDCIPPSSNQATQITDTQATLTWNTNDSLLQVDLRWRAVGAPNWTTVTNATSPLTLSGLTGCTQYEYQLRGVCSGGVQDYGFSFQFRTDGCCVPPASSAIIDLMPQRAVLQWTPVLAAQSYRLRWRPLGETAWTTVPVNGVVYFLNNLQPCTFYEYQLQTVCAGGNTEFGPTYTLLTTGCGACLDLTYCISNRLDNSGEWIAEVQIGQQLLHQSGAGFDGYSDFGGLFDAAQLEQGATYQARFTPAFVGQAYQESFRVWIDLDQNGVFTSGEVVFSSGGSSQPAEGPLTIPAQAPTGVTRMRVVMQFLSAADACPFLNGFGEIEDYCVEIVAPTGCPPPLNFQAAAVDTTQLALQWDTQANAVGYRLEYRPLGASTWSTQDAPSSPHILHGLAACTTYELRLQTQCDTTFSATRVLLTAATDCLTSLNQPEPTPAAPALLLAPNPCHQLTRLSWSGATTPTQVVCYDAQGRRLQTVAWPLAAHSMWFDASPLPPGLYWLSLVGETGSLATAKLIKTGD